MNIVKKRKIFLLISSIFVVLSLLFLFIFGLKFSIDFTGGTKLDLSFSRKVPSREGIKNVYESHGVRLNAVQETENGYAISSSVMSEQVKDAIVKELDASTQSFEVLGPTIGDETRTKAITAVIIAVIAITTYIAIAFWKSGETISSWKFGVSAIVALIHDVVITLGAFSLFGLLFRVQIDSLFITAILTIMGFSVHDTIVVFDRIRENLKNNVKKTSFKEVVGKSISETMGRSLSTSILVLLVLTAMLLFGGESIRWFVVAFMIGIIVGTYSSIFVASPILIEWYNFDNNNGMKKLKDRVGKFRKK